jgi:hypothetical protein
MVIAGIQELGAESLQRWLPKVLLTDITPCTQGRKGQAEQGEVMEHVPPVSEPTFTNVGELQEVAMQPHIH